MDAFVRALGAEVAPVTAGLGRGAAQLRARYPALRLPAAIVLASARSGGSVLTTDRGWPPVAGVVVTALGAATGA